MHIQRHTHTNIHTYKQTDTHSPRLNIHIHTYIHTYREQHIQTQSNIRHTYRHTYIQTYRDPPTHTCRRRDAERQNRRYTGIETETHIQTERYREGRTET